jgi:hypothetical protein
MLLNTTLFLTFWVVILVVFHKYTHKYIDLLYLTFLCFVMGSYISFVKPGYFVLHGGSNDIVFSGFHKFVIVDVAVHFFFLLFVYQLYYSFYKPVKLNLVISAIVLIFVYVMYVIIWNNFANTDFKIDKLKKQGDLSGLYHIEYVYGLSPIEFIVNFAIATSLYFSI